MDDLIRRQYAVEAVCGVVIDEFDVSPTRGYEVAEKALSALPSAEAVSMEEHIKELNDLAVEWKAKFAKAETITDEIYDETMAKVAKECEKCKERLRNIRKGGFLLKGESHENITRGLRHTLYLCIEILPRTQNIYAVIGTGDSRQTP